MVFTSCELINPAEPIPSYITVEDFEVQSTTAFGSASHKITDIYVLVDNVSLGAYPLPVTFPVLETGSHQVTVSAGIVVNGISNARGIYPFYENYKASVVLESGQVTLVAPSAGYRDITVSWLEDFESSSGFSLEVTSTGEAPITGFPPGDPAIFEGNNSGRVVLPSPLSRMDLVTSADFILSINTSIFLEIDYQCNNAFEIGVVANFGSLTERQPVLVVNPKEEWNKLYVDLNPGVVAGSGALNFKVYFSGTRDASVATGYYYFDNLKLLHN